MDDLSPLADQSFCYVTTTGRRTGNPHEIEIWFGWAEGLTIYMLAGGGEKADWVANIKANPAVKLRIADHDYTGTARVVTDDAEDALARKLLAAKYQKWQEGTEMSSWARTALLMAIDLAPV
ncbi:MAG TPA: nitroreductase family deazaflavin-dependent oxidoreductase [Actinomycetota bacterium]|nr:nitroreductase family deazaflavin-dependent oxidoreductase [Actinomycetota bacterium]